MYSPGSLSYPAWKVSQYDVSTVPYCPVFGLNMRNYGTEKNSYSPTFSP